jgi:ribosomal protein S18 acetylase RimI-like enzyme
VKKPCIVRAFLLLLLHLCSMNEKISEASISDIPQLLKLINSAYRGEDAKKGWTHEANLIDGDIRTDENSLKQVIKTPGAAILKYEEEGSLLGCVYLQKKGDRLYLGMLSVSPDRQAQGIGKKLLDAANDHAKFNHCSVIEMTVISVRKELIQWYERNGYHPTFKREPFPNDGRFGNPRQQLEFIYLEKNVQ